MSPPPSTPPSWHLSPADSSPLASPDSEKSSRAASSLLANLWQYSKLHRDFRAVCPSDPGQAGPPVLDLGAAPGCRTLGWGGAEQEGVDTGSPTEHADSGSGQHGTPETQRERSRPSGPGRVGPGESRARQAGTLTLGLLSTAEGLSEGGLPGPIARPSWRRRMQCSPAYRRQAQLRAARWPAQRRRLTAWDLLLEPRVQL